MENHIPRGYFQIHFLIIINEDQKREDQKRGVKRGVKREDQKRGVKREDQKRGVKRGVKREDQKRGVKKEVVKFLFNKMVLFY